jgi:hypothetical protein
MTVADIGSQPAQREREEMVGRSGDVRGDLAIVLTGGGARAAYQIGLLRGRARRLGGDLRQLTFKWRDDNFPAWSPIIDLHWRHWGVIGFGVLLVTGSYAGGKKGRV